MRFINTKTGNVIFANDSEVIAALMGSSVYVLIEVAPVTEAENAPRETKKSNTAKKRNAEK